MERDGSGTLTQGSPAWVLAGHHGALRGVSFSPDGARAITPSADGSSRVWDTGTAPELHEVGLHKGRATAVSFSPDGRLFVERERRWQRQALEVRRRPRPLVRRWRKDRRCIVQCRWPQGAGGERQRSCRDLACRGRTSFGDALARRRNLLRALQPRWPDSRNSGQGWIRKDLGRCFRPISEAQSFTRASSRQ